MRWPFFALLTLFALACVGIAVAYARIDVPQPNQLALAQASIVYYSDGKTEMARINDSNANREDVTLKDVPVTLQHAVIAAEDRSFYTNPGIDIKGIARAVYDAVRGNDTLSGGSTITQQYVKNYFLTQDRRSRASSTRSSSRSRSTGQLLQGRDPRGLPQHHLLRPRRLRHQGGRQGVLRQGPQSADGLPRARCSPRSSTRPSLYDPALGQEQLVNLQRRCQLRPRRDGVAGLAQCRRPGEDHRAAQDRQAPPKTKALSGTSGYIVAAVREELKAKLKLTDDQIDQGGLRVTTTIDKASQDAAVAAVQNTIPSSAKDVYAGLAAIRPGDGSIVAMYGGADYLTHPLNSATQAVMQAGSTFKPFALIGALERGVSENTRFSGSSPFVSGTTRIPNEFDESFGRITLRTALADSVNTAFLRLNQQIGPQATREAAVQAGIPAPCAAGTTTGCTQGLDDNLANVLGTASPHVLDVANAYATIAAKGRRATPHLVAKATSDTLGIDYTGPTSSVAAFSADVAADTLDAMQGVVADPGATGTKAAALGRPVAGKTGTTDQHMSVWWTGVIPQLSVSVGMYRDVNGKPQPLQNIAGISELSGNSLPLSIWLQFMQAATQNLPVQDFPQRAGIGDDQVVTPTFAPPTTQAPSTTTAPPSTTTTVPPTTTTTTQQPTPTRTRTRSPVPTPSATTTPVVPGGGVAGPAATPSTPPPAGG